jgi:predicted dehydrogenase
MHRIIKRRDFLKQAGATGVGLWAAGQYGFAQEQSPNEKLNIGVIGVGGQGGSNLRNVSSQNIVALCDVDGETLARAAARYPKAATYQDYREMLDRNDIDAVVVSTPDHTHAMAAALALAQKRHVYCEKPLTHSLFEARVLTEGAKLYKVATQMGNQGHSSDGVRRVVELVEAGVIGPIREAHVWTDRPIWPQGIDRPAETPSVPSTLRWDLWLGPAPERPYNPAYHPFRWRGWWDFGTGALGDMGCHNMDPAFWALKLGAPTAVEAEGPPVHPETAPKWMIVRWQFPERDGMPPLTLTWYDGGKRPPEELFEGQRVNDNGSLFIGDKGKLYLRGSYGENFRLLPASKFADFEMPERTIPSSIGHHEEWIEACKRGTPTGSNFVYAGALTEMILLGNVAYRIGERIEWDSKNLRVKNVKAAEELIRPEIRKGWNVR